jgi:hypothetical protein
MPVSAACLMLSRNVGHQSIDLFGSRLDINNIQYVRHGCSAHNDREKPQCNFCHLPRKIKGEHSTFSTTVFSSRNVVVLNRSRIRENSIRTIRPSLAATSAFSRMQLRELHTPAELPTQRLFVVSLCRRGSVHLHATGPVSAVGKSSQFCNVRCIRVGVK